MNIHNELILNRFGQNINDSETIFNLFQKYSLIEKKEYLKDLAYLIIQSKPIDIDIEVAIQNSEIKETFTPCVLLKKNGLKLFSFEKIIDLPEKELEKALILFLQLFKIAYNRRYQKEKQTPSKWWYWDLSNYTDDEILKLVNL
jgi:hypothetical protein